jgi:hypothetical protein
LDIKAVTGTTKASGGIHNSKFSFAVAAFLLVSTVSITLFSPSTSNAETGIGKDVFKIIISIFGVTEETGDLVATATVNGNSKVKSFDADALPLNPPVDNSAGQIIEYLASFPGQEVKPGDEYKVCVMILDTSENICHQGNNGLGKRPEVVDISLDNALANSNSKEVVNSEQEANS